MSIYVNIASIAIGIIIIAVIFQNMIRKKINEYQALFWLLIGAAGIILGIFPGLLSWIAEKVGIWYPPAILFAVAFAGLVLIAFYHTITISVMNSKIHELAMQVALLKFEAKKSERTEALDEILDIERKGEKKNEDSDLE